MFNRDSNSVYRAMAGAVILCSACIAPAARAQQNNQEEVTVTTSDAYAATDAGPGLIHGLASRTPGAKQKLDAVHHEGSQYAARIRDAVRVDGLSSRGEMSGPALKGPYFYPADLASGGGPTVETARMHAVYLNANGSIASNWGDPEGFLSDLNRSTFIHLVDQYVGAIDNNRYPVGGHSQVHYGSPGTTFYESDIAAIVHAVALKHGAGTDNIYHVFLPRGTDTCFDITAQNPTPVCYSPDNPAIFDFCGYHDAVAFNDIGLVLYTVEPWQGSGSGCEIATATPNGVLVDSTDNVLSHETFETITDPLPGSGFLNLAGGLLTYQEIGDECVLFNLTSSPGTYTPPIFVINHKKYAVQLEYSNTYHACASIPYAIDTPM